MCLVIFVTIIIFAISTNTVCIDSQIHPEPRVHKQIYILCAVEMFHRAHPTFNIMGWPDYETDNDGAIA